MAVTISGENKEEIDIRDFAGPNRKYLVRSCRVDREVGDSDSHLFYVQDRKRPCGLRGREGQWREREFEKGLCTEFGFVI